MSKKISSSQKQKLNNNKTLRRLIFIISLFILIFVWFQRESLMQLSRYGYVGIFLINLLASATVIFPVPGVATVFLGGALWNPIMVGLISGVGAAFGELTAYFIGYGGRGLIKSHKLSIIEEFFRRAGFVSIFFFATIPFPFDFIGIIAGSLNYSVRKFVTATILGRVVRNTIIALAGARIL